MEKKKNIKSSISSSFSSPSHRSRSTSISDSIPIPIPQPLPYKYTLQELLDETIDTGWAFCRGNMSIENDICNSFQDWTVWDPTTNEYIPDPTLPNDDEWKQVCDTFASRNYKAVKKTIFRWGLFPGWVKSTILDGFKNGEILVYGKNRDSTNKTIKHLRRNGFDNHDTQQTNIFYGFLINSLIETYGHCHDEKQIEKTTEFRSKNRNNQLLNVFKRITSVINKSLDLSNIPTVIRQLILEYHSTTFRRKNHIILTTRSNQTMTVTYTPNIK